MWRSSSPSPKGRILQSGKSKEYETAEIRPSKRSGIIRLLKNKRTQDFAANQGITWKFILEKAPWWGGYYERMVQLVQRSPRKVIGKAQLSYEELETVLIEVVVNSFRTIRPCE